VRATPVVLAVAAAALVLGGCGVRLPRFQPPKSSSSSSAASARAAANAPLAGGPEPRRRPSVAAAHVPPTVLIHGPRTVKDVALTFDDGPDGYYTPQILSILEKAHVQATFFLVGQRVAAHAAVVRRMVADGDAVGNHTWDHPALTRLRPGLVASELGRAETAIASVTGFQTDLFRPPYGDLSPTVDRELAGNGYHIIFWGVDSLDWKGLSRAQILRNVLPAVRPGSIILQHCASGGPTENLSGTVAALPVIISTLRARGYRFVTIPQMFGIPESMAGGTVGSGAGTTGAGAGTAASRAGSGASAPGSGTSGSSSAPGAPAGNAAAGGSSGTGPAGAAAGAAPGSASHAIDM